MRHSSAKTTLDVYGHMWPDKEETTRAAIGGVIAARGGVVKRGSCGETALARPKRQVSALAGLHVVVERKLVPGA
jgi:hypothetical protein